VPPGAVQVLAAVSLLGSVLLLGVLVGGVASAQEPAAPASATGVAERRDVAANPANPVIGAGPDSFQQFRSALWWAGIKLPSGSAATGAGSGPPTAPGGQRKGGVTVPVLYWKRPEGLRVQTAGADSTPDGDNSGLRASFQNIDEKVREAARQGYERFQEGERQYLEVRRKVIEGVSNAVYASGDYIKGVYENPHPQEPLSHIGRFGLNAAALLLPPRQKLSNW